MSQYPKKPKRKDYQTDREFKEKILEHECLRKQWLKSYKESWRSENREKTLEYKKAAYSRIKKDPEKSRKLEAYNTAYRSKNSEILKDKRKACRSDKELLEKQRVYYRNYHRRKTEQDVQYIISRCLRARLRKSLEKYSDKNRNNSALDLIGCSIEEFVKYIEDQFVEGMTWTPKNFHLDHIQPCSSFDLTDLDQQKLCFHYTNYQPLWPLDNLRKSDKILPEKAGET